MLLEFKNLYKKYGVTIALSNISFTLHEGICAMLGPNGAGKSTLMNITAGLLQSDCGNIYFDGKDIREAKTDFASHLGYMPQNEMLYSDFTVKDFLAYIGALKGVSPQKTARDIEYFLEKLELSGKKNERIKHLSGGMKQRLRLAQALLGDSDVIILDEPTAGMDPEQRIAVRNLLAEHCKEKIIIFSTHVVSDIEYVADSILIINKGHMLAHKTRNEILKEMDGCVYEVTSGEEEITQLKERYLVSEVRRGIGEYHAKVITRRDQEIPEGWVKTAPGIQDAYLKYLREFDETSKM